MKQKERQERSRQEILLAAMAEFGTHNYEDVTMEGICTAHGISKGMMYHYYANKDAVFLAVSYTHLDVYKRQNIASSIPYFRYTDWNQTPSMANQSFA